MATKKKPTTQKGFDFRTIKTFEDACKKLNINPEDIPVVYPIPEEFRKAILAVYRIMIIFKAINDGWTPDWNNDEQYKYYPWFYVLSSGFGFSGSTYYSTHTPTSVGSRLCTDSSEKALYIAEQFKSDYQDFLLYSE